MQEEQQIMGMPVTVEISAADNLLKASAGAAKNAIAEVFNYFHSVDEKFSPFKNESELMRINRGEISRENFSAEMSEVLKLSEDTRRQTGGFFDIRLKENIYDPSGLVKGWAIWNAAKLLENGGFKNFYISVGGDIQASGKNSAGEKWSIGIKNPFNPLQIVKVVRVKNAGIATSGTYEQGQHIYIPQKPGASIDEIVSITVIGPNIYEADRFATAAFAMGNDGIDFIENRAGLEAYVIDRNGATSQTSGFSKYL